KFPGMRRKLCQADAPPHAGKHKRNRDQVEGRNGPRKLGPRVGGIYNCAVKQMALLSAKPRPMLASMACGSRFFMISTRTAPAASPNIAREMAMNAKWYHIVTLKIRVKNSSSCKRESVVKKRPT